MKEPPISVIGLGYVGLPLTLAFAESFKNVVGYGRGLSRVAKLKVGIDRAGESEADQLKGTWLGLTADLVEIWPKGCLVVDIKGMLEPPDVPVHLLHWCL